MHFDHDKLDVYRLALDFMANADAVASAFPRGRSYLADQLRRAATSVVLNIAEGAGEFAAAEKARFFRMARRSAVECAAVFDIADRLRLADAQRVAEVRSLAVRIVSMLVRMIRRGRSVDG